MSQTVLALAQSALLRSGETSIPSTIIGSSDPGRRVREFLYEEVEFLRNQKVFNQLKKKHTITVSAADVTAERTKYPLPEDFYAMIADTFWDETNKWQLTGPLSDSQMRYRQMGHVSVDNRRAFRIFGPDGNPNTEGGQIELDPVPTATATLSFEYITKTTFIPALWLPSTAYSLNDKVSANGNIYTCSSAGTSSADDPPSGTSTGITDNTAQWDYVSAPQEEVNLDTDLCLFDDDIIKSGIKWRWEEMKGTKFDKDPFTGVPRLHMKLVDAAKGRWLGSYKISFAETGGIMAAPSVAEGSWSI